MIEVIKDPNSDSRSADQIPTKEQLTSATERHIADVNNGMRFIANLIMQRGPRHDNSKISMMDDFYNAIVNKGVKESGWYHKHITLERHHLKSYVPENVNLIDVIEHVVDCTMAGLTRSGTIYDTDIPVEVLQLAVKNTVELIKKNTTVVDPEQDMLDQPMEEIPEDE